MTGSGKDAIATETTYLLC